MLQYQMMWHTYAVWQGGAILERNLGLLGNSRPPVVRRMYAGGHCLLEAARFVLNVYLAFCRFCTRASMIDLKPVQAY